VIAHFVDNGGIVDHHCKLSFHNMVWKENGITYVIIKVVYCSTTEIPIMPF